MANDAQAQKILRHLAPINREREKLVTAAWQFDWRLGMKFNAVGLAMTCAILWGASMFLMGLANMIWSGYGQEFVKFMASVYPGYQGPNNFLHVVIGTAYGIADGFVGGFVFAWLYNRVAA